MLKRFIFLLLLQTLLPGQESKVPVTTGAPTETPFTFALTDGNFTAPQHAGDVGLRARGWKGTGRAGLTFTNYGGPAFRGMPWAVSTDRVGAIIPGNNSYIGRTPTDAVHSGTTDWTNGKIHIAKVLTISPAVSGALNFRGRASAAASTYTQPSAGVIGSQINNKLEPFVSVKDFGAKGDGVTDDTAAIQAAHAASTVVFYPDGVYRISWREGTSLVSYATKKHVHIVGHGAKLYDTRNYTNGSISSIFSFNACKDVVIDGLNYEGQPLPNKSDPTSGVGYLGATFVNLANGCEGVTVNADLKYLRYGIRGGDYTDYRKGYNNQIKCNLTTFECGYGVALYLTNGVDLNIHSESGHRTAYLAGVKGGLVRAYFKNNYIAPIQVLVTDATTNGLSYPHGISRGSSDLDIVAHDLGSTTYVVDSFCAGISMSRGDAETTFENLKFDIRVRSNDTMASRLSAFALFNNFTPYQPSYPNNWSHKFYFKNITITGIVDRSSQTVEENRSNGEIYIYAFSSGSNYGTLQGVDIKNFKYYPGKGAKTRGFYFFAPGLIGGSSISDCDFGTETPVTIATNSTSTLSIRNTQMRGSYSSTSDSPYNSHIIFSDCIIADSTHLPYNNKTFINTTVKSTRGPICTRIIDSPTLSGASVNLANAIPPGVVVLGVTAIVRTPITGALGWNLGVATDTTRYASNVATAMGTSVTPVISNNSSAPTSPKAYTDLIITPKTPSFTGGQIRITIQFVSRP